MKTWGTVPYKDQNAVDGWALGTSDCAAFLTFDAPASMDPPAICHATVALCLCIAAIHSRYVVVDESVALKFHPSRWKKDFASANRNQPCNVKVRARFRKLTFRPCCADSFLESPPAALNEIFENIANLHLAAGPFTIQCSTDTLKLACRLDDFG